MGMKKKYRIELAEGAPCLCGYDGWLVCRLKKSFFAYDDMLVKAAAFLRVSENNPVCFYIISQKIRLLDLR